MSAGILGSIGIKLPDGREFSSLKTASTERIHDHFHA